MKTKETEGEYRRKFFSELSRRVAYATDEYPTTHCWSYTSLRNFVVKIRKDLLESNQIPASFARSEQLIKWLEELGLAYRAAVEPGSGDRKQSAFFIIALGAGVDSEVSPYELLQAFEPKGTICFFSALSFHNLTTQSPPFHHIATLVPRINQRRLNFNPVISKSVQSHVVGRNPLGALGFTLEGVAFYSTRRSERLVSGTQVHIFNPQTRLRFTDIEQSLLDTLMHPFACGGESVIFEAWEKGWPKVDDSRLLGHLQEAGFPLIRRFGALRRRLGLDVSAELALFLESSKRQIRSDIVVPLQLLRGISGPSIDEEWFVSMPA